MKRFLPLLTLPFLALPPLYAQEGITFRDDLGIEGEDRIIAESFVRHAADWARKQTPEAVAKQCAESPEMFAWIDFKWLDCLTTAYRLTGDTAYLDLFAEMFTLYEDILSTGPDPFLGWYGLPLENRRPAENPELQADEIQMNFRAIGALSRWVEAARTDPAYAEAHRETIDRYLALMEEHLFPKWDERGHFVELENGVGIYVGLDYPIPTLGTLSHEKYSIMVDGLLALHRVTGDDRYLRRALQQGAWFKRNLILKDGHYQWMSWAPSGERDVHPEKEDAWRVSWMAPDPNGAWYVTSLSIALNLYQHGLLFTDQDLDRFLRTQKEMAWNGDLENPEYRNVAGETSKWIKGRFLSHQLAPYDPLLRQLAFDGVHQREQVESVTSSWKGGILARDYLENKYLSGVDLAEAMQPYAEFGEAFLADPANRAFYEEVFFEVEAPGAPVHRKPSDMFGPAPEGGS